MSERQLNNIIKELRTQKGITQEQLAEMLDVSVKTVSRWETGEAVPPLETLGQIASVLGVEAGRLMSQPRPRRETTEEQWERIRKTRNKAPNANLLLFILRVQCFAYGLQVAQVVRQGRWPDIYKPVILLAIFVLLTVLAMAKKDKLDDFARKYLPDGPLLIMIYFIGYLVIGLIVTFIMSVYISIKHGVSIF